MLNVDDDKLKLIIVVGAVDCNVWFSFSFCDDFCKLRESDLSYGP